MVTSSHEKEKYFKLITMSHKVNASYDGSLLDDLKLITSP
jgi:hypothetical protein